MNRIILFTRKYPYGYHETFLDIELQYLSKEFEEILILPDQTDSNLRDVPDNVLVDTTMSLQEMGKPRYFFRAVFSIYPRLFIREILNNFRYFLSARAFWRSLSYMEEASRVICILDKLHEKGELDPGRTICYTYWLRGQALGVSLFKKKFPELIFVSRAHRGDLYEERNSPPYLPFRYDILQNIDSVFPISQHGFDYLQRKYKEIEPPAKVARLGVKDPGFSTSGSRDGVIRIASCSTLKTVKRVGLLIAGLSEFSRLYPDCRIEWNHLGSGPLRDDLIRLAKENLNDNISWRFQGQLPHDQVIGFYRSDPVDIFINVSSSEGIPVSIMEAQSCGIPVIATAVGGTPEIVNDQNGRLLEADPSPEEIAVAIQEVIAQINEKKVNSKKQWEEKYNAEGNYNNFIEELKSLLD